MIFLKRTISWALAFVDFKMYTD